MQLLDRKLPLHHPMLSSNTNCRLGCPSSYGNPVHARGQCHIRSLPTLCTSLATNVTFTSHTSAPHLHRPFQTRRVIGLYGRLLQPSSCGQLFFDPSIDEDSSPDIFKTKRGMPPTKRPLLLIQFMQTKA